MTKLHLTRTQLLEQWRLRAFPEPVNDPAAGITRVDGIDVDALLNARMDDWYARLLAEGPARLQAPVDQASQLQSIETSPPGARSYRLPEGFKRLTSLTVADDSRTAVILADDAARLYDPRRRIFDDRPVALVVGNTLTVYPDTPLDSAMMVCDTGDDMYHLDAAALSDIQPWV